MPAEQLVPVHPTGDGPIPCGREPITGPVQPQQRPREDVLADAIRVLTEAVRLSRPVLRRDEATSRTPGQPLWLGSGRRDSADWAEFVTQALAGAAANVGGIETALAGRAGSWEAGYVRALLSSTVGEDEQQLLRYRTEPIAVDVFVDEILVDLGVWKTYDDAQQELTRRYDEVAPTAPSPEQARELPPLNDEQEQQLDRLAELDERLEHQRREDWAQYGQALKDHIEAAASRQRGLRVPIVVNLDLDTFRTDGGDRIAGIEGQLLQAAIMATPLPGATQPLHDPLTATYGGRSPLDRLTEDSPPPAGAPTPDQGQQ
jgi:hypothetical protein